MKIIMLKQSVQMGLILSFLFSFQLMVVNNNTNPEKSLEETASDIVSPGNSDSENDDTIIETIRKMVTSHRKDEKFPSLLNKDYLT
jgi:hypothetical protein